MQIIPAIDIFEGKCVRLAEGEFDRRKNYDISPHDKAMEFRSAGAKRLHVVDLEGAKEGKITNWSALRDLLALDDLDIQVGGGLRDAADIRALLEFGASRVVIGSMAVTSPETVEQWIGEFGSARFCIALDVKDGAIATHGWQQAETGSLEPIIRPLAGHGVKDFLSTDVRRDGMMAGPNVQLYEQLVAQFPSLHWIASGGVRSTSDIDALARTGVTGVVIGKALYEHRMNLRELFS